MMTAISPGRSIALVEYISHLSVGDWESVARDLGQLGFTKPGAQLLACPAFAPGVKHAVAQEAAKYGVFLCKPVNLWSLWVHAVSLVQQWVCWGLDVLFCSSCKAEAHLTASSLCLVYSCLLYGQSANASLWASKAQVRQTVLQARWPCMAAAAAPAAAAGAQGPCAGQVNPTWCKLVW